MSNEILTTERAKNLFSGIPVAIAFRIASEIDKMLADEREQVISEIEKIIDPLSLTKNGEHYPHNKLIKLLNQLKTK